MKCALRLSLLLGFAMVAMPAQIDYTFTGTADGSLNGVAFGGPTAFAITLRGNTVNVVQNGGLFTVATNSMSISLQGIGVVTGITPVTVFSHQLSQGAGFYRTPGLDLFDTAVDASLSTYALATDFGPISGSTASVQFWGGSFGAFATSGGTLVFNDTVMNGTFHSVLPLAAAAEEPVPQQGVPEPSTAVLALVGLGLYGWRRMRRQTQSGPALALEGRGRAVFFCLEGFD